MTLIETPVEIFLQILKYLEIEDIFSLRNTCKALQDITRHRSVWFEILKDKVVGRNIPTPGATGLVVASATAQELEEVCVRAITLRRNWISPHPRSTYQTSFVIREQPLDATGRLATLPHPNSQALDIKFTRCLALYFLPDRGNRYLVVILRIDLGAFGGGHKPPVFEIQCRDIAQEIGEPRLVARYPCDTLLSACVNVDSTHPACMIVTRRTQRQDEDIVSFPLCLDFNAADQSEKQYGFRTHSTFSSHRNAVRLQGSFFFASDETHCVRIINIDTGNVLYRLNAPLFQFDATVFPEEYKCLNSLVIGDFVLMFRQQWIHLYEIPGLATTPAATSTESANPTEPIELHHVAEYKWPWRIDTVDVMAKQPHALRDQFNQLKLDNTPSRTRQPPPTVHILLRFASIFPWPVNILHSYVLPFNPEFDMSTSSERVPVQGHLPYLPTDTPEASEAFKPYIIASISSPVRIFTPSDTAMGGYGTILYMDAQSDTSVATQAGDRGQRIAGKLLESVPRPRNPVVLPRHAVDLMANENASAAPAGDQVGNTGGDNSGQRGSGMVFHIQEDKDDWSRIAMCEEEGIVVVGCTGDRVSVYRYI